jgi:electron transport complex protein RnfD
MSYSSNINPISSLPGEDLKLKINKSFLLSLVPMMLMSTIFFGLHSLRILVTAVITSLLFEYIFSRFVLKTPATVRDGSAVIIGVLLAFSLPAGLPLWLIVLGALIAIGITKISFGRFGANPFNPVLLSWLFLRISFPVQMTTWTANITMADSFTGATPLGLVKEGLNSGKLMVSIATDSRIPSYFDMFWGNMSGSLGEISAIAILIGGIYLLWKKIITWHIPVAILGTLFIFESLFWLLAPGSFMDPIFHLITGGVMLAAFFLATNPHGSPSSHTAKLLFGTGVGLITILIRNFTLLPEGVAIAILIMNGFVPFINKRSKKSETV